MATAAEHFSDISHPCSVAGESSDRIHPVVSPWCKEHEEITAWVDHLTHNTCRGKQSYTHAGNHQSLYARYYVYQEI
jgi:hypothetical protein